MNLKEFDLVIDRMNLAYETAKNLGQPIEQVKILYQMNEFLPGTLQISLEDWTDENISRQVVGLYKNVIYAKISEIREQLMLN